MVGVGSRFAFDRSFLFEVEPVRLWSVLQATDDYPRWWRWLRTFDAVNLDHQGLVPGGRARCVVRAPLPYSLRFEVVLREVVPGERVEAQVDGDLRGPARLEISPHEVGSSARLSWDLELRQPALSAVARVARPLLEWGHDQVVARGVDQFRRHALP